MAQLSHLKLHSQTAVELQLLHSLDSGNGCFESTEVFLVNEDGSSEAPESGWLSASSG